VVDDHELLRRGVAAVLEEEQDIAVVAEASNGREAVAAFATHRPDVTLMDLQMPDMSGTDAIAERAGTLGAEKHTRTNNSELRRTNRSYPLRF
jgi:DNA-binding NarL/FixJ family response regulator